MFSGFYVRTHVESLCLCIQIHFYAVRLCYWLCVFNKICYSSSNASNSFLSTLVSDRYFAVNIKKKNDNNIRVFTRDNVSFGRVD